MQTFEVRFPLDSGFTLSVLMAAPDAESAKDAAHKTLRTAAEPRAERDVIQFNWRFDEVTADPVEVCPLLIDTAADGAGLPHFAS